MVTRIDWKNCQSHWTVSTMRINFRTLLPFLLFCVFKGSLAQPVVVNTYTNKSVETLECSFTSPVTLVQWIDQSDDGNPMTVFFYDVSKGAEKHTNDRKYDNFNYAIEGTNGFNLVITNVDRGDEGQYQCNRIGSSFVTFDVIVEVLPESINMDCTEFNCMPPDERPAVPQINCVCTATGLSSSVLEIKWEGVDIYTASNTTRVMDPTTESFSISSNVTFHPPVGTFSLSCSLTGYKSEIPESLSSSTHTYSPPVCNLEHVCPSNGTNASLICSCSNGSTKVKAYSFYESQKSPIGTQRNSSKSVQVDTNKIEMFYCSGCNGVHNQLVGHEVNCKQGSASPSNLKKVIPIVIAIAICAGLIVLILKKHWPSKGKGHFKPGSEPEDGPDDTGSAYENTSGQERHKLEDPRRTKSEPPSRDPESEMDCRRTKSEPPRGDQVSEKNYRKAKNEASGGDSAHKNDDSAVSLRGVEVISHLPF